MKHRLRLSRLVLTLNRFYVLALSCALLLALGAGVLGWLATLEQRGAALREGRFEFSLNTIRSGVEAGLQVGLLLPDLPGAQQLIEQSRSQERVILSIDIFDAQGHIVFTTDSGGVGAVIPAAWRAPCLTRARGNWSGVDEEGRLVCGAVINGFDQVAGGVALRYRLDDRAGTFGQLGGFWLLPLLWAAGLALVGGLFGWLLLRPVERRLLQQSDALAGLRDGRNDTLTGPVAGALLAAAAMQEEFARIDAEADRLDNLESR
ncbi:hypothetical protein [Herbaspirillum robiniae]|uniref:HAMP domain-containing protein n=1 Tax=Herbaspirillum robiniae TaxID=2014887 RepID=A0A246WMJ8_9BURK|nr:hypothetical protein [Herbaspirillum robiniae]NUU03315.1 hypothetical protein [Herbaspirillum robiniae]OWY26612.1 hypothetical protein CEJ42_22900 [Herbaspirillum robiniae]